MASILQGGMVAATPERVSMSHTVSSQSPVVLALDLGGTRVKAGLVQDDHVSALTITSIPLGATAAALVAFLEDLCQRLLSAESVSAIGVCVKGIVDGQQGVIRSVNEVYTSLIDYPLGSSLHTRFGMPIIIENDARMYALGELVAGAGKTAQNMVCLTLGTGIGSGVAINRQVLRGERGMAGIFGGHLTVQVDGPWCSCGNRGCLETLIGTTALRHQAELACQRGPTSLRSGPLTPRHIFQHAAWGDLAAQQIVAHFTQGLSAGIISLIHAYDTDIVVIGGGISGAADQFLPQVRATVAEQAWTFPKGRVRIDLAALGNSAALIGVAALTRHPEFVR